MKDIVVISEFLIAAVLLWLIISLALQAISYYIYGFMIIVNEEWAEKVDISDYCINIFIIHMKFPIEFLEMIIKKR